MSVWFVVCRRKGPQMFAVLEERCRFAKWVNSCPFQNRTLQRPFFKSICLRVPVQYLLPSSKFLSHLQAVARQRDTSGKWRIDFGKCDDELWMGYIYSPWNTGSFLKTAKTCPSKKTKKHSLCVQYLHMSLIFRIFKLNMFYFIPKLDPVYCNIALKHAFITQAGSVCLLFRCGVIFILMGNCDKRNLLCDRLNETCIVLIFIVLFFHPNEWLNLYQEWRI